MLKQNLILSMLVITALSLTWQQQARAESASGGGFSSQTPPQGAYPPPHYSGSGWGNYWGNEEYYYQEKTPWGARSYQWGSSPQGPWGTPPSADYGQNGQTGNYGQGNPRNYDYEYNKSWHREWSWPPGGRAWRGEQPTGKTDEQSAPPGGEYYWGMPPPRQWLENLPPLPKEWLNTPEYGWGTPPPWKSYQPPAGQLPQDSAGKYDYHEMPPPWFFQPGWQEGGMPPSGFHMQQGKSGEREIPQPQMGFPGWRGETDTQPKPDSSPSGGGMQESFSSPYPVHPSWEAQPPSADKSSDSAGNPAMGFPGWQNEPAPKSEDAAAMAKKAKPTTGFDNPNPIYPDLPPLPPLTEDYGLPPSGGNATEETPTERP